MMVSEVKFNDNSLSSVPHTFTRDPSRSRSVHTGRKSFPHSSPPCFAFVGVHAYLLVYTRSWKTQHYHGDGRQPRTLRNRRSLTVCRGASAAPPSLLFLSPTLTSLGRLRIFLLFFLPSFLFLFSLFLSLESLSCFVSREDLSEIVQSRVSFISIVLFLFLFFFIYFH